MCHMKAIWHIEHKRIQKYFRKQIPVGLPFSIYDSLRSKIDWTEIKQIITLKYMSILNLSSKTNM
jgi:hypothetical protein